LGFIPIRPDFFPKFLTFLSEKSERTFFRVYLLLISGWNEDESWID